MVGNSIDGEDTDDGRVFLAASIFSCLHACLYCELLWHDLRPLRTFGCDWVGCWATVLSFRSHNLPHTDTGYVQPSSCCPLVLTGSLPTLLQSVEPLTLATRPPPFLARMITYSTQFVNKRHMICLTGFFFLPSMPKPCALVTQARIRQNSMNAYKQPNAKFMSCGISCSVINYRSWFQVKKANCSLGSLLTLRNSLLIESKCRAPWITTRG